MATVLIAEKTLADVLRNLGDIPPERIRFPVDGNATETDVVKHLDSADKRVYELIDGVLVEKAMGRRESFLAAFIAHRLEEFVERHDLGLVFAPDGPFRMRPGRIRFPDTGFVSWDQYPSGEVPEDAIDDAVPELTVEVISESNTPKEMEAKLVDYFTAGVRLVWYVYPETKSAIAHTSPTRKKHIAPDGSLDGGKVLPGFTLPLAEVFARLKRRKRS